MADVDIRHVAKLASLSLTDEEASRFEAELAAIVAYVKELDAVDTTGVAPTANVQLEAAGWREDVEHTSLSHDEALAQAPRAAHDGFAVPTFVES